MELKFSQKSIYSPPITPQTNKRTKSKTVRKKSIYSNKQHNNSVPVIPRTNVKKRKLDKHKCNLDTNNNNKNEPCRKKRKLNTLIESYKLLKQQNYELKQEINKLRKEKKEANKWKTQYIKLCSRLRQISFPKIDSECEIEIEINETINNENNQSPSPTPPPSKYFHKPTDLDKIINNISEHKNMSKKDRNNIKAKNIKVNVEDNIRSNNVIDNKTINAEYDSIRDLLLGMGYDRNKIINRISLYNGSGKNPQFVFKQLINTFTTLNKLRQPPSNMEDSNKKKPINKCDNNKEKKSKNKKKCRKSKQCQDIKKIQIGTDHDFENSYYISVNCHMCHQHFDDVDEYKYHIKEHYDNNPLKTWWSCDFGCKKNISSSAHFIGHIASHTKDYPYKCNVMVDGNKCQLINKCNAGTKGNIKHHWNSYHNKNRNTKIYEGSDSDYENSTSESSSCYQLESGSESELEYDNNTDYMEFERSHLFLTTCHICQTYFDDFHKYTDHLQKHYDNDANKKWMVCDFGCTKKDSVIPVVSSNITNFLAHIAKHTKEKPFKCNVTVHGIKCEKSMTTKGSLMNHWKSKHFRQVNKKHLRLKTAAAVHM